MTLSLYDSTHLCLLERTTCMYNWPFSLTYILSHSLVAHLLLVCCVYLDDNAETTPDSEGIRVQSESSKRKWQLEKKKHTGGSFLLYL